jgi:hypothetical protein
VPRHGACFREASWRADPKQQGDLPAGVEDRRRLVVPGLFVAGALLAVGERHARRVQSQRHRLLREGVAGRYLLASTGRPASLAEQRRTRLQEVQLILPFENVAYCPADKACVGNSVHSDSNVPDEHYEVASQRASDGAGSLQKIIVPRNFRLHTSHPCPDPMFRSKTDPCLNLQYCRRGSNMFDWLEDDHDSASAPVQSKPMESNRSHRSAVRYRERLAILCTLHLRTLGTS